MSENEKSGAAVAAGVTGVGCGVASLPAVGILVLAMIVVGGLGVLFWPIVVLKLLFEGGGGGGNSYDDIDTEAVSESVQGDGKGELNEETVPTDLADTIEEAGGICSFIGPVVIAAQLERESSFNKDMRGANGEEGISQLPPDKFEEFGEDEDDNDETKATDAEDSIMAQGRYMCSLAEKVKPIVDNGEAPDGQGVLDLTLAAYEVGLEEVQKAKGIPESDEAQAYVAGVRSLFPRFEGIGGAVAPSEFPSPTMSPP